MKIASDLGHSHGHFGDLALIISRDNELAGRLQGILHANHGCQSQTANNYDDAERLLRSNGLNSIFIDLRPEAADESPVPLLQQLSRRNGNQRIPVIAIAEKGYVREWAQLADLTVHGHLEPPLDGDKVDKICQEKSFLRSVAASPMLTQPRVVETQSVTYRTYTPHMYAMVDQLVMMASHDVTLLLIGETGTGKTTIARMIHELSPRRDEIFMNVGCGALPGELIESELFGHVRGSFTGAERNKIGKFEAANGGSLLLDEIDTMTLEQQAKLLRVIETGEFEPVGSNETRRSNTRLIVASNRDLSELMEQNEFRADLYYRLNVLEFRIPPLRERPMDIVPLTLSFVQEFCAAHNISIRRVHPDFLGALKRYNWPGNIRELKNHIRRACLFCQTGELTVKDLATNLLRGGARPINSPNELPTLSEKVACTEKEILKESLRAHDSNRTATARSLGISRVGLYKKMKKYGMLESRRKQAD